MLYQSQAGPKRSDAACSGAMYIGRADRSNRVTQSACAAFDVEIDGEVEIEQRHPSLGRHPHIGGFDVAVDFALAVQRTQPLRQLSKGGPHAQLVECLSATRVGHAHVAEQIDTLDQLHHQQAPARRPRPGRRGLPGWGARAA